MTMNYTLAARASAAWMPPFRYATIVLTQNVQEDIDLASITGDDGVTVSLAGKSILIRCSGAVAIRRGDPSPALVASTGYVLTASTGYTAPEYQRVWVDPGLDTRVSLLTALVAPIFTIVWSSDQ